jgi:magnesium-transporting ATPase (P-type)
VACNDTSLEVDEKTGNVKVKGSITEAPLLVAGAKVGFSVDQVKRLFPRVDEVPFNSARKMMATLHRNVAVSAGANDGQTLAHHSVPSAPTSPHTVQLASAVEGNVAPRLSGRDERGREETSMSGPWSVQGSVERLFPNAKSVLSTPYFATLKGAPNYILDACTRHIDASGGISALSSEQRKAVMNEVDQLSAQALRVLAIAFQPMDSVPTDESSKTGSSGDPLAGKLSAWSRDVVFVGLIASVDPAREGVREAIETAHGAGIRTIVITGDYIVTAVAIAKSIGLIQLGADAVGGLARDAKDLRTASGSYYSDQQIDSITDTTVVFARATPEDKLVIVKSLQRLNHVVAMTGDGVNDGS